MREAGRGFVEFTRAELEGSLPARFERFAARMPDAPAIVAPGRELTYGALNAVANRLARAILGRPGPSDAPVAVLVDHDVSAVVSILAILKAGRAYLALEATHPAARLRAIVDDAGADLVVAASPRLGLAQALAPAAGGALDADAVDPAVDGADPRVPLDGRALAFLGYTSGSTGTPKGVLWDHRGILHRAREHVNAFRLGPGDRLSLAHRPSVSASFRHMWGALLSGAALVPYDLHEQGLEGFGRWLGAAGITHCHVAASVFRHFAGALPPGENLPDLRLVWVGNEPVFRSDAELFRARFSRRCRLVNGYALTEAGTVRAFVVDAETPLHGNLLPIGYPLADKEVLLLDEGGRPVAEGDTGEIAIRSEFLALGYWRRPDLDRQAFRPDPEGGAKRIYLSGDLGRMEAGGCLVHVGRKDAQPKLRGRFVDPIEVERRLLEHPRLSGAAVVVREDRPGDQRLVAYWVAAAGGAAPTVGELRAFARERLPEHLVPSLWVMLPTLPRSGTGKLDRLRLPAPGRRRPDLATSPVVPRSPIERELSRIWADALGLDEVGIHDDFLDLGGHSLLAASLVARVREAFGVDVSAAALLEAPRVSGMATVIVEHLLRTLPPGTGERWLDGLEAPEPGRGAAQPAAATDAPAPDAPAPDAR